MDTKQIDEIMVRTGADYETAKAALESCDGQVEIAVRVIQAFRLKDERAAQTQDSGAAQTEGAAERKAQAEYASSNGGAQQAEEAAWTQTAGPEPHQRPPFAREIIEAIKEIWKRGNASRLDVEKEGKTLLSLSLSIGAIGLVLAPLAALIGLGAALITDYIVTITLDNGTVINVNEFAVSRRNEKDVTPEE